MKTLYKNPAQTLICLLAIAAFGAGCSQSLTYQDAMLRNQKKIENPEKFEDAQFLIEAQSYNLLAKKVTEAAITSAYSASVVALAKKNHEEHLDLEKEIRQLARREKVTLPATMSDKHQVLLSEITSAGRRDFDKTYIRVLESVNAEINERYMAMATDAESEDVRAFAARKLDMFKSHQSQLEVADQELLNTY